MISASSKIKPERLPPTERATFFQSLRVYLQVTEWKTLTECPLDPVEWGWKLEKEKLIPVMIDVPPAPDELLNIVRCNCKMSSKNPCGGRQCSCRNHGLKCVPACGDCRGLNCSNCDEAPNDHDEEDDIYYYYY